MRSSIPDPMTQVNAVLLSDHLSGGRLEGVGSNSNRKREPGREDFKLAPVDHRFGIKLALNTIEVPFLKHDRGHRGAEELGARKTGERKNFRRQHEAEKGT